MNAQEKDILRRFIEKMMERLERIIKGQGVQMSGQNASNYFALVEREFASEMAWFRQWIAEYDNPEVKR